MKITDSFTVYFMVRMPGCTVGEAIYEDSLVWKP